MWKARKAGKLDSASNGTASLRKYPRQGGGIVLIDQGITNRRFDRRFVLSDTPSVERNILPLLSRPSAASR